jgi:hypothetical protein
MGGVIGFARRGTASEAIHRHIGVFQSGESDAAVEDRLDLLVALPRFETEFSHRGAEASDVVIETEEIALPDAHHVVRHIRAAVAPVRDGNCGLADRHVTAVDIGCAACKRIV